MIGRWCHRKPLTAHIYGFHSDFGMNNHSLSIAIQLILILPSLFISACTNETASVEPGTLTLTISAPSYPNKKISAYVFRDGALAGILRSSNTTNATGTFSGFFFAADTNNCTATQTMKLTDSSYNIHVKVDGAGTSSFVYPSGCTSDAGFLSTATLGYFAAWHFPTGSSTLTIPQGYLAATATVQFNLSGTGLNAVSRQTYCSILDGQISSPTIQVSSTLGYAQGSLSFTAGTATATTTATFSTPSSNVSYKYACWVDANNSSTYNSGDLISSGSASFTNTVSSWQTVP